VTVDDGLPDIARCPRCAALVRPGSPWCTLCYADVRPRQQPPPPPSASAGTDPLDPLTAPLALLDRVDREGDRAVEAAPAAAPTSATGPAGWPCLRCGATVPLDDGTCTSCGAGFLEGTLAADPVLGRLGRGQISNQTKAFIMIGGSVGLLLLGLGLMYLLGSIF
jgi:hypothetical protein